MELFVEEEEAEGRGEGAGVVGVEVDWVGKDEEVGEDLKVQFGGESEEGTGFGCE